MTVMENVKARITILSRLLQKRIIRWCAKRPVLLLSLIIVTTTFALPAVMTAALTPVALFVTYTGMFATIDGAIIVYGILFKGFLLAVFMVSLFIIGFLITTCIGLMHTYRMGPLKQTKISKPLRTN